MSKSHMKTEELLYEKHFPFKVVKDPLLPLVVKGGSKWDTAVLHKNHKTFQRTTDTILIEAYSLLHSHFHS